MEDIKTFFRMIGQVNYILTKSQKRKFVLLFFLGFGSALFETIGVSAILPFIQAILTPETIMEEKHIAYVLEIFHISDPMQVIVLCGGVIILIYLIKNIYLVAANYWQTSFRCHFHEDISIRLLNSYLKRPYSYFITTTSAAIIQAIQNDSNSVYDILSTFYQLSSQMLTIVMLGAVLVYSDFMMALSMLVIVVGCFMVVTVGFKKKLGEYGANSRKATQEQYKFLYQSITGNKDIKVMQRDAFFVNHFNMATKRVTKSSLVYGFITSLPDKIIEAVCVSGIIGLVCFRLVMGVDVMNFIPKLAIFAVAAFRILPAVAKCVGYFQTLVFYRPSLEAAYNDMAAFNAYERDIKIFYEKEEKRIAAMQKDITHLQFEDEFVMDHIKWKYDGAENYVINGLSLKIRKGEAVALIGTSGAGKTTLADIILGLLRPEEGHVQVDGIDIFAIPKAWSDMIGYVPQSVFLIDDTIKNNITFGIDESEVRDEDVWNALEWAQLKEYVEHLPDGLETQVGERGIRFSGGQRQRIAIARALYHNPEILVLDEATSALDGETERALMEAIDSLYGKKTLIVIAHRLSTIKNCDRIYEIKNGQAYPVEHEQLFGQDN